MEEPIVKADLEMVVGDPDFLDKKIAAIRLAGPQKLQSFLMPGKLIHSLNKNEHALDMAEPVHEELGDIDGPTDDNASVKKRTNVLLLGDHLGDLEMSNGLNYETRISVGFLNHNIENSLSSYREAFDAVFLNDAPMTEVVKLVSLMCSNGK